MQIFSGVVSILLILGSALGAAPATAEEGAVRQIIGRYVEARNHSDEAALRTLFTADADQLVSTGQWRRGLENLLQGAMASSKKETGRSSVTVESVRFLGRDVAVVDGRYETAAIGAQAPRKMWSTFVLHRSADGWRIAAIRNMLPAPAAQ